MSLSRYRSWLPGGPQNRVLFSDFFMKLIKNKRPSPPNLVTFQCDVRMTKFDIKNYLEQIYKVPVAKVNTAIIEVPHLRDHRNRRWKPEEDYKLAYVTLGEGQTFEFPELFKVPAEEREDQESTVEDLRQRQRQKTSQWLLGKVYCHGLVQGGTEHVVNLGSLASCHCLLHQGTKHMSSSLHFAALTIQKKQM